MASINCDLSQRAWKQIYPRYTFKPGVPLRDYILETMGQLWKSYTLAEVTNFFPLSIR
jgi:hypothetical protein